MGHVEGYNDDRHTCYNEFDIRYVLLKLIEDVEYAPRYEDEASEDATCPAFSYCDHTVITGTLTHRREASSEKAVMAEQR